jgi:2-(S-pantetheinyl)-carbapenam-3-carboxylate methyltransferase
MRKIYIVALHQIPFLPYVYGLLRNVVEEDAELSAHYEFGEPIFLSEDAAAIADRMEDADVVGFSCYVWNFRRQMKIASLIRRRFPNCLVVAGGPHIPNRSAQFCREYPFVDVLVHGEGEAPFAEVLRRRLRPEPEWHSVEGITYRIGDTSVQIESPATHGSGVQTGSPYLRGHLKNAIELCHARETRFYALWETNRGCPYSCTFCDWGSATMSRIRSVPMEQIRRDIEYFGRHRIPNLFICDANFGILPRDVEIARLLAESREKYGYPQQVRVNFAKESNDRVFEISSIFDRREMLMGTTLSMQSMDTDVLAAVERRNIGFESFQRLSRRYRNAGIHTYSELIVGLPNETRRTFENGIGSLLDGGNHDDIRVFDFMILPNSPVNDEASFARYGLRTVRRPFYLDAPEGENEIGDFVVETATMPGADWVHCQVFAQAVQFLHNGCYARYLAIHLRRASGLPYADFYRRLIEYALSQPETVLGSVLNSLQDLYRRCASGEPVPYVHMIASRPAMLDRIRAFGNRRGWTPDQWAWLAIALDRPRFYRELQLFLESIAIQANRELSAVLAYQSDIVLDLSFDPRQGKRCDYEFDLPAYFAGGELVPNPVCIWYRDTHMGVNRQYPLVANDPRRFAKAAVGESYPFVRIRHFQHQLADARVTYAREHAVGEEVNAAIQ